MDSIRLKSQGYIHCKSMFYSSEDNLRGDVIYTFSSGVNIMRGEIDSGVWAVSYLMSMYGVCKEDFVLFEDPEITIDNVATTLEQLNKDACYLDCVYPVFNNCSTVKEIVEKGVAQSTYTAEDVRLLFGIDRERFVRPISGVGNERFRVLAAIGFSYEKNIFCFPWISQGRYLHFQRHINDTLKVLASLDKIVILPVSGECKMIRNRLYRKR